MTQPIQIGPHTLRGRAALAPMAGLTDQAFRNICRSFGATLAASEMNTADMRLWNSPKSTTRLDFAGENGLRVFQIAGSEPGQLADAVRAANDLGADIVDINMGCPAKKVCKKLSGSALLQNETLVGRILDAVTRASCVPVTLKMRTGWNPENRNGVRIAKLAESLGIAALAVHGRTRACMFKGDAEYDTIREIKSAVDIPVLANGDIDTVEKALYVLRVTDADAVMIGRGALGRPWVFAELNRQLNHSPVDTSAEKTTGEFLSADTITRATQRDTILIHLNALHRLYGEDRGVRIGRKHLTWYCKYLDGAERFRNQIVRVENAQDQLRLTEEFLERYQESGLGRDSLVSHPENLFSAKHKKQKDKKRWQESHL